MKHPFKHEPTPQSPLAQEHVSSTLRDLTDVDLQQVQGGKDTPHVSEIVVTKPTDMSSTKLL